MTLIDEQVSLAAKGKGPPKSGGVASAVCLVAAVFLLLKIVVSGTKLYGGDLVYVNAALILLFTACWRARYKSADLTTPIYWINGVMAVIFVVHPAIVLANGTIDQPYMGYFDLRPNYSEALFLGTLAIISMNLAYLLASGLPVRNRSPKDSVRNFLPENVMPVAIMSALIAVGADVWLAMTGFLTDRQGGDAGVGRTAYLYQLPLFAVSASCLILLCALDRRSPKYMVAFAVVTITQVSVHVISGSRTSLLLDLAAPSLVYVLKRSIRIPRTLVASLVIVGIIAFGALRDVNAPGENFGGAVNASLSNPSGLLTKTFGGSDTEMVDGLAVEIRSMPAIGYHPGSAVASTFAHPVPRTLWQGKPVTWDVTLNAYNFGKGVNTASVAYSYVGEGYFAGGAIGVVLLSAIIAFVYDRIGRWRVRSNNWGIMVKSLSIAMIPTVIRGVVAYDLAIALFLAIPSVLAWFVSGKVVPRSSRTAL